MEKHKAIEQMQFKDIPLGIPFKILESSHYQDNYNYKDILFYKDHAVNNNAFIIKSCEYNVNLCCCVNNEFIQLCEVYFLKFQEDEYNDICEKINDLKAKLKFYESAKIDSEKRIKEMKGE